MADIELDLAGWIGSAFSPTVAVSEIEGGHLVTVTDVDGDHPFSVMDGAKGDTGDPGHLDSVSAQAQTLAYDQPATASAVLDPDEGSIAFSFGLPQGPPPTDSQVAQATDDWLVAHPEATTTVEDGAVTIPKLNGAAYVSTESVLAYYG